VGVLHPRMQRTSSGYRLGPLLGLFLKALDLVLLYAAYEPAKLERAALRWFGRYLDVGNGVTLLQAQVALAALAELRGGEHEPAARLLAELTRQETPRGQAETVAAPTPDEAFYAFSIFVGRRRAATRPMSPKTARTIIATA
jgi:hypothetical protein